VTEVGRRVCVDQILLLVIDRMYVAAVLGLYFNCHKGRPWPLHRAPCMIDHVLVDFDDTSVVSKLWAVSCDESQKIVERKLKFYLLTFIATYSVLYRRLKYRPKLKKGKRISLRSMKGRSFVRVP
jgi:hypothetical protein